MATDSKAAFAVWLANVDRVIDRTCGLSHDDLTDQTWWDWFDSGMSSQEAALRALENEGFPFDEEAGS